MTSLLRRSLLLLFASCLLFFALAALPGCAFAATMPALVVNGNESNALGASQASAAPSEPSVGLPGSQILIPGPRRSFLRMAGISQKASIDETLPLLANEVRMRGYVRGKPTEYLVLLKRYLQQAQRLAELAGPGEVIEIASCDQAQPLLDVLGYRLRSACGPKTSVLTSEPELAFLTIDSGFPLAQLEEALRQNKPFTFPYPSSKAPVLFTVKDWMVGAPEGSDLISSLIGDPALARLYSAMSRMDAETASALREAPGIPRLLRYAGVLDFYGSHITIRSGHVLVPGGTFAGPAWKTLVGASPDAPTDFISHLVSRDQGWLAAYFDAAWYASPQQQNYFVEQGRLRRFYDAFRGGPSPTPSASRSIFRPSPGLPLLMTRLALDPDGQPHVPGNLEVWHTIFREEVHRNPHWRRLHLGSWSSPDQLVEALFSETRDFASDGPLECFLTLNEIDRGRNAAERLSPETVQLLTSKFTRYGDQYAIFAEFHSLDNQSISTFVETAENLDHIASPAVRANATGIFQATLGLWQILARQGEIAPLSEAKEPGKNDAINTSWQNVIAPFAHVNSGVQAFESGEASFKQLIQSAGAKSASEDEIIALLAGPEESPGSPDRAVLAGRSGGNNTARQVRQQLAAKMRTVIEAQRLVSLDSLFVLGSGLNELAEGKREQADSLLPAAAQLKEFEMPRAIFTASERLEYTQTRSDVNHTALQAHTNFVRIIKSGSPRELAEARGRLAAFLRDTLVGLNYAYYEPPGAQMLHSNAIFVRSHDYSEDPTRGAQPWKSPQLVNLGVTASGGAHLCGSLADLPYILAVVEQEFIVPDAVQSLIWQDLVPTLLSGAVVPRWWNVTPVEMHAVALYQRAGEELLRAASGDDALRSQILTILSDRMLPQRLERTEAALRSGSAEAALAEATPADTFFLTAEFRRKFPDDHARLGSAGQELDEISRSHPAETSWERLSQDFGGPHPALAHSNGRELVNMKLFPVYLHYSSRLMAESWDSNNLYWARLADELGYDPATLNRLVPELTRRMVEKLFATDLEDWPAVLRATRETGEEFRAKKSASGRPGSTVEGETSQQR